MGTENKCSVCAYHNVKAVNRDILTGHRYRVMAPRYPPLSRASIWRHAKKCLKFDPAQFADDKRIKQIVDVYSEMLEQFTLAKNLRIATQEYLSDPSDPSKVTLAPHASEIYVVYYEVELHPDGIGNSEPKRIKKTATLQDLLERGRDKDPNMVVPSLQPQKMIDVRRYALDAIHTVDLILDKFARFEGMYSKERENAHTVEKALDGLRLYMEMNPDASEEQVRHAVELFARGISVSEAILLERAKNSGIIFEFEKVQ